MQYDPFKERRHMQLAAVPEEVRSGMLTIMVGDSPRQIEEGRSGSEPESLNAQLYLMACTGLNLMGKKQLTLREVADIRQSMITLAIKAEEVADEVVMRLAVETFRTREWRVQGYASWRLWCDATLPSSAKPTWRTRFDQEIRLWLAPIAMLNTKQDDEPYNPIRDQAGRVIDIDIFLDARFEKTSFAQEAATLIRQIDLDKPDQEAKFREIVCYAATHTKGEFRAFLHTPEFEGLTQATLPEANEPALPAELIDPEQPALEIVEQYSNPGKVDLNQEEATLPPADEVMFVRKTVDASTGELEEKVITRITVETDSPRLADAVRGKLSAWFRFPIVARTIQESERHAEPAA
jgi:hypothetical protein